ncbi:MAG: hypothetical protein WB588_09160 [Dehalococcoidia bacterium]
MIGTAGFGLGGGYLGFSLLPTNATPLQQFLFPGLGTVAGLVGGVLIIYGLTYFWHYSRMAERIFGLAARIQIVYQSQKVVLRKQILQWILKQMITVDAHRGIVARFEVRIKNPLEMDNLLNDHERRIQELEKLIRDR